LWGKGNYFCDIAAPACGFDCGTGLSFPSYDVKNDLMIPIPHSMWHRSLLSFMQFDILLMGIITQD
jgi:hypothetical protein